RVLFRSQAIPPIEQLVKLGLGYLSLNRKMGTLSGGEAQRVKIARHLGSSLNNMVYIFDEPSAGLHPEEVDLLIQMLKTIKANYNTVIVIEHDASVIRVADEIIEMGPGAGVSGGDIVYQGGQKGLENTLTATLLDHKVCINNAPRQPKSYFTITQAADNNLQDVTVQIPK